MEKENNGVKLSRRALLGGMVALGTFAVAQAKGEVESTSAPKPEYKGFYPRQSPIVPAGSQSLYHFQKFCTSCQLCVNSCPNGVLVSSNRLGMRLAQPMMSYERGFCRPDCSRCSKICPTGAIKRIDRAEKSSTQIGVAVLDVNTCVVITDEVSCDMCARRCPSRAITMVKSEHRGKKVVIPAIDTEHCIGCGACEHYCPGHGKSAIHVEGLKVHRHI